MFPVQLAVFEWLGRKVDGIKQEALQTVVEWGRMIAQSVQSAAAWTWAAIVAICQSSWDWLWNNKVSSYLPESWSENSYWASLVQYFDYVDLWIPLNYGITLAGLWVAAWTGLYLVRVIVKLIPTIW